MPPRQGHATRRQVLGGALALATASAVSCGRQAGPYRFFTVDEGTAVSALAERIIPADQDPGAAWAGVAFYIDRQLTSAYKDLQGMYRQSLAALDAACRSAYGAPFAELKPERQDAVMAAMEKKAPPFQHFAPFFETVLAHTQQGFWGSPRHGGNRDHISWRMLGVGYPPVRGRNPYDLTAAPEKRG